ncbi:hypothetical protein TNCV_4589841 [Trichonephila clavipes]|nr:hypothetical protein TNCV_4589841 [Trichonephila clavipes]
MTFRAMAGCRQNFTALPETETPSKEGNGDWFSAGLINQSFLKPSETITADMYCKEIKERDQKILLKRPALVNRKTPILLHDNSSMFQ